MFVGIIEIVDIHHIVSLNGVVMVVRVVEEVRLVFHGKSHKLPIVTITTQYLT